MSEKKVGRPEAPGKGGDQSEAEPVVAFEHKLFNTMEGGRFILSDHDDKPIYCFKMGDNDVSLPFEGIKREFGLDEDSPDGQMLDLVAEALFFIKELVLGDPLPREVTTGEASWEVEERHRITAYQRITVQLASWISGDEHLVTDAKKLATIAEDPGIKEKINRAFDEAASNLGFTGEQGREEVVKLIEQLAEELSHIEALREKFAHVLDMEKKIHELRKLYANEMGILEVADPVAKLMTVAVKKYRDTFTDVDSQTGEIISALRNIGPQTEFIRKQRNDLYRRLVAWEEMFKKWGSIILKRSQHNEDLLRETHRFLAPRFMQKDDWVLFSQLQKDKLGGMKTAMRW